MVPSIVCHVEKSTTCLGKKPLIYTFFTQYFSKSNTSSPFRFLRKQLQIAKDARRVDVLFYRIFLSHELLIGTEKYQALLRILDEAVKKLEREVGSIDSLNTMARLIVNRLSSGAQVQKLCASALELLDSIIPDAPELFSSGHHDEKSKIYFHT